MKLALFDDDKLGLVNGNKVADVTTAVEDRTMRSDARLYFHKVQESLGQIEKLSKITVQHPLESVALKAPAPCGKLICAFVNYTSHAKEVGAGTPPHKPELFLKAPSSVIGPNDVIRLPRVEATFHHEAELAVIIGKRGRNIEAGKAMDYVLGYSTFVDVSARGLDDHIVTALFRSKSYDTFGPLGPYLVTKDEIDDPHSLAIKLWVDGQVRHDGNTSDMIFKIPTLIEYASSVMTLHPGDVLATGSPAGIGTLKPGQALRISIEKVGEMTLRVE